MGGARSLRAPLALAVLTLLAEKPRHPYDMQATIRERGVAQVVKVRGGSLYDAITRLERAGLVERVGTGRQGARPERTVYAITEAGSEHLHALLTEFLGEPTNEYPRFVAALAHLAVLEPAEAAALLRERAARLETERADVERSVREQASGLPRVVLLEVEYAQRMRECEAEWLREVAADIDKGMLPWPQANSGERVEN